MIEMDIGHRAHALTAQLLAVTVGTTHGNGTPNGHHENGLQPSGRMQRLKVSGRFSTTLLSTGLPATRPHDRTPHGGRSGRGARQHLDNDRLRDWAGPYAPLAPPVIEAILRVVRGTTARGARGRRTAKPNVLRLADPPGKRIMGGLSSGEGLIHAVRDPSYTRNKDGKEVIDDPGARTSGVAVEQEF